MNLVSLLNKKEQSALSKSTLPDWIDACKATLTEDFFWDNKWSYEWKLDGERVLARKQGASVKLYSRTQHQLNGTYPEIVKALEIIDGDWWLDGEIVAIDGKNTSFKSLQPRIQIRNASPGQITATPVFYYLFDCMHFGGYDIRQVPYAQRRKILHRLIHSKDPVRLLPQETGSPRHFQAICRKGWEGFIVKDLQSPYESKRTKSWLKFKCVRQQEFVIAGYTDPHGSRQKFGALIVGYYDNKKLRYAGKVGTGFDDQTLQSLYEQMARNPIEDSPFDETIREKGSHFVYPKLVAEIGFSEWTNGHKLRHPRYLGLRDDKQAQHVVRESA